MAPRAMLEPTAALRSTRPLVVAHRAGNALASLRHAEKLGADLIEADVRLFRGRSVVRHLKTIGRIPFYWDRWTVASPRSPHLGLAELLSHTAVETELMLDLKGPRRRLAELVLDDLRPHFGERRFTVCARRWGLLEAFEATPVRRVASVGSARQLRELLRRFTGRRLDGVAVHERLLEARVVADIRAVAELVLTWPVNDPARARALVGMGVAGLISDDVARISPAVTATA